MDNAVALSLFEKLQVPGLLLASVVIYFGFRLFMRIADELHQNTLLLSKMAIVLDVVCSRLISVAPSLLDKDNRE